MFPNCYEVNKLFCSKVFWECISYIINMKVRTIRDCWKEVNISHFTSLRLKFPTNVTLLLHLIMFQTLVQHFVSGGTYVTIIFCVYPSFALICALMLSLYHFPLLPLILDLIIIPLPSFLTLLFFLCVSLLTFSSILIWMTSVNLVSARHTTSDFFSLR